MDYNNDLSLRDRTGYPMLYCSQSSPTEVFMPTQVPARIGWGVSLLDIPRYWQLTKGKGIRVAVLDTAIATNHPNLKEAVAEAVDYTGENQEEVTCKIHGTHCAGIIAGRQTDYGSVGIAPEASIYSAVVVNKEKKGRHNPMEAFVKAVQWAIKKQVHIISISLACNEKNESMQVVINQAIEAGVFVVAAVGNSGTACEDVDFPAQYKGVIAVGAVDEYLNLAAYSSQGKSVDLVAPGKNILSTYPPDVFATMDGTSTAAPFVAGLLALCLCLYLSQLKVKHLNELEHQQLYYKALKNHLLSSTIELGQLGKDLKYGRGLIDPKQLLSVSKIKKIINSV
ncbi:MAG: S8 family serine peptidase [Aureispira sp.]